MIKIVGIEFIPRLGNGRPENGTGTFVEALMYPALSLAGFWTDNSLHQWPRLFVADHLDNIPRFIEHLDFSAPVTDLLSRPNEKEISHGRVRLQTRWSCIAMGPLASSIG
jgi:hypothetical protein